MITRNAQAITAIAAVLTLLVLALVPAVGGLYWLMQLNGKVDYLQAELEDTQQEMQNIRQEVSDVRQEVSDVRREIQDTRRELLAAFEQSEQRLLNAISGHTHDDQGKAIFSRPVGENDSLSQ